MSDDDRMLNAELADGFGLIDWLDRTLGRVHQCQQSVTMLHSM